MIITIQNPKEDQYGNSKENILLAFDENKIYLGSAFAYPAINFHQTHETPYLIFIGINPDQQLEKTVSDEVKQMLFDKIFQRAKELRQERPDLKARIYSGFEANDELMDFYIKNGFEKDYSILMETNIVPEYQFELPADVTTSNVTNLSEYKTMYDELFVTPLDLDALSEQSKLNCFQNLYFYKEGTHIGGCTIFEKDGSGYIETIYILPEAQGKGISKIITGYTLDYFSKHGLHKATLEVWELNKRAVQLYKAFGFVEVAKNLMFPGITL